MRRLARHSSAPAELPRWRRSAALPLPAVGVLSWIVLGFLAGTFAGMVTRHRGAGCINRIVVGVVGALVGGALARAAGQKSVTFRTFTLRGLLVAIVGASLLLLVLNAVEGRTRR